MYDQKKAVMRLCLAGSLLMGAAVVADTLSLEMAVAEAQASNPGLAAIQERAKALAEIPSQV